MTCNYKRYLKVSLLLCKLQVYRVRTCTKICSISSVPQEERSNRSSKGKTTQSVPCDQDRDVSSSLPHNYQWQTTAPCFELFLASTFSSPDCLSSILLFPPLPSFTLTTLKKQCDDNPTGPVPPKPRGICVFDGWNPITLIASLLHPSPLLKLFALENKIWLGLRKG